MIESLPPEFYYWIAFSRSRYHYWNQHQAGLLDDETYLSYMASFVGAALGTNQTARQTFISLRQQFPEDFVDEVNRLWEERYPGRPMDADL